MRKTEQGQIRMFPQNSELIKIYFSVKILSANLLFLFLSFSFPFIAKPQDASIKNIGVPFINNYSPKELNFNRQTWDISTLNNGLVYFANSSLLVAGNRYWNNFEGKSNLIRSVHALNPDSILVGGPNEIGLFVSGKIPGEINYHSLMGKLDSNYRNFGTVWKILNFNQKYYLRAGSAVLEYDKDTIVPLLYSDFIDYMGVVNDTLFVSIANRGLGTLIDGEFKLLPFGAHFSSSKVHGVFSEGTGKYYVFADNTAFFIENNILYPFIPSLLAVLEQYQVSVVRQIKDDYFAIGTVKDGIYIISKKGEKIQHFNKHAGLQNNTIISMLVDENDNLWLGLDNGISYIEVNSCLTKINSESDIGTGYVAVYHNGRLYLGTNQGLFYTFWDIKNTNNNSSLELRPVTNTTGQVWSLFKENGYLYCGHHKGIYLVDGDQGTLVDEIAGCWKIDSLVEVPGYYLEATYRGFFILKADKYNTLKSLKKLEGLPGNTRTFLQDSQGYIWIVTPENKIFRFRIDPETLKISQVEDLTDKPGLPEIKRIKMVGDKKRVFFSTHKGIFHFNQETNQFVSNDLYNQIVGKGNICYEFFEDDYDRIWYVRENEIGFFSLHFGKPEKTFLPFTRFYNNYTRVFGSISVLDQDNVLFGVDEGFYHYKNSCTESYNHDYRCFVTRFESHEKPVSWALRKVDKTHIPVYAHKRNAFIFSFTSNIFVDPQNVYYRYKLEGQDHEWSAWTTRPMKEYNNLFEGEYTFKVMARNKYGFESGQASFTFAVKPPYYRSTFAYIVYGVLLLVILFVLRFFRNKRIELEKQKIEEKKHREMEEKKKHYEEESLKSKQRITELVNEKLEQELVYKSKELSNSTFNILRKNKIMQGLKVEMQQLYLEKNLKKRDLKILGLMKLIENEINTKKDWKIFDSNFQAVHDDFIHNLQKKYPGLNQSDIRLCTFLKMNKTTKEIATLMNMSIRGVETSRYRLRKKMGLSRGENLFETILSL